MVQTQPAPLLRIPAERQQRELEHARKREELEKIGARRVVALLAICAGWQVAGAGLMLLSARVADERIGRALFAGAFAVGYAGAFFSLMVYYVNGRNRGDW